MGDRKEAGGMTLLEQVRRCRELLDVTKVRVIAKGKTEILNLAALEAALVDAERYKFWKRYFRGTFSRVAPLPKNGESAMRFSPHPIDPSWVHDGEVEMIDAAIDEAIVCSLRQFLTHRCGRNSGDW